MATQRLLEADQKSPGGRIRSPRADAVKRMAAIVSTIIANLVLFHHGDPKWQRIAIPMRNTALSRYDRPGFSQLPDIVSRMAGLRLILKHPAHIKVRRTGIEAAGELKAAIMRPTVSRSEVGRAEGGETIWLTARTGRDARGNRLANEPIDYADTDETRRLRSEMDEINHFLRQQRIELEGEFQAATALVRRFTLRSPEDPHRFDLHGRVYGGFWINLKAERRAALRINGEPVADLDFASMFPRLAYAKVGVEAPEGDLYAIAGLEKHRGGVKAGFSALLSTQSDMSRLPSEVKAQLPTGWTAQRFREAVAEKHAPIAQLFGRDVAMELMFTESRILVTALHHLRREGIAALPMHDGMMVAKSNREAAIAAMRAAAVAVTGVGLPVTEKI